MLASTTARTRFQRLTTYQEPVTYETGDTSKACHHVIIDPSLELGQEQFEDGSQKHERGTVLPPWKGPKSWKAGFKTPLHKTCVLTLGDFYESALGKKQAQSTITGAAGFTATGFTYTGGTPHNWVIVAYGSGRLVHVPIARLIAGGPNQAIYAYQLPTAAGITSVKNPSDFGAVPNKGQSYIEDPAAGFLSFSAETDRAGDTGQLTYKLTGAVPTGLILEKAQGDRMKAQIALEGRGWARAAVPTIVKPTRPVRHASPWQTKAYLLTDFDAPAATPATTGITSYKVNLAPQWLPVDGTQDRLGADEGTLPQHSTQEWRRDDPIGNGTLEIVTTKLVQAHLDNYETGNVDYHVAIIDYIGDPGSTGYDGSAHCLYFPKCRLIAPPQEVDNGGWMGHRLLFHVIDERDVGTGAGQMSTELITKLAAAFFMP